MFWCYHQNKEKTGFSFRPFNSFLLFAAKRLLLHRGEGADEKWTLKSLGTCQPASYTASPPCATDKAQCLGVPAEPQPYPAEHMRPSLRLAILIFVKSISENLGGSLRTCFGWALPGRGVLPMQYCWLPLVSDRGGSEELEPLLGLALGSFSARVSVPLRGSEQLLCI